MCVTKFALIRSENFKGTENQTERTNADFDQSKRFSSAIKSTSDLTQRGASKKKKGAPAMQTRRSFNGRCF